jgi:F-type H+-transporting ATPase subunit epsilon
MDNGIHFIILTPSKKLLDEKNVTEVSFPSELGTVGILPGHAPMVSAVGTGVVLYSLANVSGFYKVNGGVAEVTGSSVTLMVDTAEEACDIDVERARRALERAEGRLAAKDLGNIDVKRAEAAKARAIARIETAELYQNRASRQKTNDSK